MQSGSQGNDYSSLATHKALEASGFSTVLVEPVAVGFGCVFAWQYWSHSMSPALVATDGKRLLADFASDHSLLSHVPGTRFRTLQEYLRRRRSPTPQTCMYGAL